MKSLGLKIAVIVGLTLTASWLRLADLGVTNLHDDEFYQFETAANLLRGGDWARYDYYAEAPGKPYDRAKLFIYQVQFSLMLFGETETAARLPAALWGIILIPVVMISLLGVLKHQWLAYGTGLALAFDHLSIGLSQYVRMYSMLMVLAVLVLVCVYSALEATTSRSRLLATAGAVVGIVLSVSIFKELTVALLAAIGLYSAIRTVSFIVSRHASDLPWVWMFIGGSIAAAGALAATLLGFNIVPLDAIIVRSVPHWSYLTELFISWQVPVLAAGFGIIGCGLALRQYRSYLGYSAVVGLVVLFYFAFFSHRWDAQRYISIVIPALLLVTVVGWVGTLRFLGALLPKPRWLQFALIVPLVAMTSPISLWAQDAGYADMKTAYSYVASHTQDGEVVLMQGPRFYYWPDRTIPVYTLGGYKSLSLSEFKALLQRGTSGGWVVYNGDHQRHLRDNIKAYIAKRCDHISTLDETHVEVYHCLPK